MARPLAAAARRAAPQQQQPPEVPVPDLTRRFVKLGIAVFGGMAASTYFYLRAHRSVAPAGPGQSTFDALADQYDELVGTEEFFMWTSFLRQNFLARHVQVSQDPSRRAEAQHGGASHSPMMGCRVSSGRASHAAVFSAEQLQPCRLTGLSPEPLDHCTTCAP